MSLKIQKGGLVEQSRSRSDSEAPLAVHYQVQLTLSTEVTQCVNNLLQGQIWEEIGQEIGHVLDPTTRFVSYYIEDVIVLGLHVNAFF